MKPNLFPKGWNEERVKKVITHYEGQTDKEAVAEDEAAFEEDSQTFIQVPKDLVSAVRDLIAKNLKVK